MRKETAQETIARLESELKRARQGLEIFDKELQKSRDKQYMEAMGHETSSPDSDAKFDEEFLARLRTMDKPKPVVKQVVKQSWRNQGTAKHVASYSDIPDDASSNDVWSIEVEIFAIDEQIARTGRPYRFLQTRDSNGDTNSVVDWKCDKEIEVDETYFLHVRCPVKNYPAFTLVAFIAQGDGCVAVPDKQ